MYRNKSAVSLRTLAYSLKQSINMDRNKTHSRQFVPLRNSATTVSLLNHKNQAKKNSLNEEYLIMLDTRKSKLHQTQRTNRESNFSDLTYNLKSTKELIQRKQRLLRMTKANTKQQMSKEDKSSVLPLPINSDQVTSTIQLLQRQCSKIKQNLSQNQFNHGLKNYNKSLLETQSLAKQLKQISKRQAQFIQHKRQLQNRLTFLKQQIISTEMNFTEDLAEKQYCQEFLHQYKHGHESQFKEQAQNVIKTIQLEKVNQKITNKITQLQQNLQTLEKQYQQWKLQQNLQLKQKRFENKFKQHRIELMKIQQELDQVTQQIISKHCPQNLFQSSPRKVRQYICAYFKKYNQININHISHAEIQDGIDIFLCKEGLIKDFTKFLNQKTQKISLKNGMYSLKLSHYCDCLKKIQSLFSVQKTEVNRVIALKYQEQIIQIKQSTENLMIQKEKNLSQIQTLQQNVEKILAQQSLSTIELLNRNQFSQYSYSKNDGFFNLQEIKSRVKEMKLEQLRRIKRVKQIHERLQKLEQKELKFTESNRRKMQAFQKEKLLLKNQIEVWSRKVLQIQSIKKGFEVKKSKCDQIIDEAISKMKEKDEAENNLKALQEQIQKLKKQKISAITQKHQQRRLVDGFRSFEQSKSKSQLFSLTNKGSNVVFSKNIAPEKTQSKLKLEQFRISQRENECSNDKSSTQFRITKQLLAASNDKTEKDKLSRKSQSSHSVSKQRISLGAINSILLSKCNLVESKNIVSKHKPLRNQSSTLGLRTLTKQNQEMSEQLHFDSNSQSLQNSQKSKKQNISRKTSITKNTQKSIAKYESQRITPAKLSLQTSHKHSTSKPKLNYQNKFSKQKHTDSPNKKITKSINSIISNKLLRR